MPAPDAWRDARARGARALTRHRRPLAALTAALAVALSLGALRPPPPPATGLVVAARDLAAGHRLAPQDLTHDDVATSVAPGAAVQDPADVVGRVLAVPVRAGEPLSLTRVSGPESLGFQAGAGGGDLLAVPVRIGDAQTASLLRPGDVVDVWAARATSPVRDVATGSEDGPASAGDTAQTARRVATGVRVLAVPGGGDRAGLLDGGADPTASGGLVVLAVPTVAVAVLAQAVATDRLVVAVRPVG